MWLILLSAASTATTWDVYPADDLFGILDGLVAGDEVIVHAGTYTTQQGGGSWFRQYDWQGDANNPIIVRAATGERVIIEGDPGASQNVMNISGEYWTLSGFEILWGSHGLRIHTSAHATLEDLHIHDTADVGLSMNMSGHTYEDMTVRGLHIHDTNGTGECMYLGCNDDACQVFDSVIEWNWCHDTWNASQGDGIELKTGSYNNIIRHNVIHDVKYPGITLYDARGRGPNHAYGNIIWNAGDNGIQLVGEARVHNNIVLYSGNNGIQSKPSQGGVPQDLEITHNTVVDAGDACFRGNDFDASTDGIVANNVFLCEGANAIRLPLGAGAMVFAGNAVLGNDEGPAGSVPVAWSDIEDPNLQTVYPTPTSTLIDAGDPTHAHAVDFNCLDRTDGAPDIGAYEWLGDPNPGWAPVAGFKECAAGGTTGTGTTTGTATGTTGTTGTGTGGTTATTTGGATGAATGGTGAADGSDKGCGCSSAPPPSLAWLGAPLLLLIRRRRAVTRAW